MILSEYQLWGNLPNGAWCKSVCVRVCMWLFVCLFEVSQRYQILADMPNWTYCRLGRWKGLSDRLATMSSSPIGEQITKTFSSQGKYIHTHTHTHTHTHHLCLPEVWCPWSTFDWTGFFFCLFKSPGLMSHILCKELYDKLGCYKLCFLKWSCLQF